MNTPESKKVDNTNIIQNIKAINITGIMQNCKQYISMFIFVIILSFIIYYADKDPEALTNNAFKYALAIFIPLLLLFGYYVQQTTSLSIVGLLAMTIIALVGSYVYTTTENSTLTITSFLMKYLLIPTIIIIGLAIFYKMFMEYSTKLTGWNQFIIEFIFYIPCLLIDLFEYLKQQYRITPSVVYVLFIIEILLILLYITIPKLIKNKYNSNGTLLLDKPLFLNKEKTIGTSNVTFLPNKDFIKDSKKFRTNYAISLWVYVNPQSTSNISYAKETTLFEYGSTDSIGNIFVKPRIAYKIDNLGDKFIFYFSKKEDNSKVELSVPTQRWNNIIVNYHNSSADLFINGKLERSFDFNGTMPQYSINDIFKVGSENGIDGAICNISYFKSPLKNTDIANIYNLYFMKNPPVE